ncbi:MAG: ABC transporter ATP-binding protein [Phycisphaerales bacterium]|nr:ABC transporter ATP-binding protein [Phycisphaerae bacterium]NNF42177.1 ABC transporter ATP-binding protein [Phycisphaerales bacterium]NNM27578.1 ABC transporter ATP-binding protein [Phycisphaerales bacterium]
MVSPRSSQTIVEAVGLTKVFKDFWMRTKARAVDGVDFEIHTNEIFGLLGPNGSGKSTIIKMILGLLNKTSGRLVVFGKPPTDVMVKKHIGFLPEESYLYRFLTARETLDYYGKLFGLDRKTRRGRTDELLDMVGLTQVAHRPIGEFSKGMTRRIGLAQALINDPDFLILDEPTSGLDPIGTRQVKDLLLELRRRGKTILLSSHLLADVEDVCDRMVMLYGGKIRAQGTAQDLLADTERTVIQTPRLKAETISRIDQIIGECEGKAIERVQAPRQRLEELFLDIVERARVEQISTSGAVHGGATAAFLRVEDQEGEDLIDHLMEEATHAPAPAPATPAASGPARADDDGAAVLDELLKDEPASPPRRDTPAATPRTPTDVDDSVIDSLLGDDADPDTGS